MIYIRRKLLKELKNHLSQKEISLIVGPRQAGKTTLMLRLEEELKKRKEKTAFLSLDNEIDKKFFSSQQALIKKIKLEIGEKGYVFIDEIQRKEDAGLFLKGIYDMNLPYKLIVSGSGSLELKEKIHESLVGRKRIFELSPVSFEEFVNFKTDYRYEEKIEDFFEIEKEKTLDFLKEYLNFGGYPRIILEEEIKEKKKIIDEIFSSYLEKDISYLLKIKRIDIFSDLIKILSAQIGQLTNYSRISSELNISIQTLKNYLWYAQKTFIIKKLTPFSKNIRKEIVKSPIFYFYDLGLRNYAIGSFGNLNDYGPIFENFIFDILREKIRFTGAIIHFWRSKDGAEVDFIVNLGKNIFPIEVKYRNFKKPEIERSLRSFIRRYHPKKAFIINLNLTKRLKIKETEIIFLSFSKFITSNLGSFIMKRINLRLTQKIERKK